jgi:hypothetical protein
MRVRVPPRADLLRCGRQHALVKPQARWGHAERITIESHMATPHPGQGRDDLRIQQSCITL